MTKGRELIERLVIVRPQSAPCKRRNICDENRTSISSVMTIRFILGRGNGGKKRGKFVGSMAASINGRWLLQHCQIETIETSSSDGRTELRLASVLAHTDTHKKRGCCSLFADANVISFYGQKRALDASVAMKPLA